MSQTRQLHEAESRLLRVIREYETALEKNQMVFAIGVNAQGLSAIRRAEEEWKLFRTLKIDEVGLKSGETGYRVSFWTVEFEKYLHFLLNQAGIAYLPNSKLCFPDGYAIEV